MKKWSLRPDPAAHDPARHVLLIKGEMKHVTQIIKKFGAMCGRPLKVDHAEGYNFLVHFHGITPLGLEKVTNFLKDIAPGAATDVAAAAPPPILEPEAVPLPASPPGMENASLPGTAGPCPPSATPAPVVEPPPVNLTPPQPPAVKIPEPAAPAAETPAPRPAPAARPLWGLQMPLEPKRDFDSLLVGAYNRFAHAAATSVVGSPGTMYNPLFLYGAPGVGKTHLLHAIGGALRKNWDEAAVVVTTGTTLVSAVRSALAEGRLDGLTKTIASAKALLVDDVHLLALTESNQAVLSKIFQDFFARNLQVVLTSVYPPRALAAMEEALKISLSKGWAVDMKVPTPTAQEEMIRACVERSQAPIAGEDIPKLREKLGAGYGEFTRLVQRWTALTELGRAQGATFTGEDMLGHLLTAGAKSGPAELPSASELEASRRFAPPAPGPDAVNLALFCPKGQDSMVPWVMARFYQIGAQFGAKGTYRHVLCESYDTQQSFGVPFQFGESCRRARAEAALVLGPPRDSSLAAREGEFAHAVRHVLESFGLAAGWIPFAETTVTRPFLAAHLDFMVALRK